MRSGTAETSDNGLNEAQQLSGALVVERFEQQADCRRQLAVKERDRNA
jgi:hypothetical protein